MWQEISKEIKSILLTYFRAIIHALILSLIFATIEDVTLHFLDAILIKHTIYNVDVYRIGFWQCFSITLFLIMGLSIYKQNNKENK